MAEFTKKLYIQNKAGVQYNATIFSTEAEAGSPNLKVTVDGVNGYVPLGTSNTLPLKVYRNADSKEYGAVKKTDTVVAGSTTLFEDVAETFTIPSGVKKLKIGTDKNYVVVNCVPNKTYSITENFYNSDIYDILEIYFGSILLYYMEMLLDGSEVKETYYYGASSSSYWLVRWSDEINNLTATKTL